MRSNSITHDTINFAPNQQLPEGWHVVFCYGENKYRYLNRVDVLSQTSYDTRWLARKAALVAHNDLTRIGHFELYDEPEKDGHWFDPDEPWPEHWFDAEQEVMRRFSI